VHHKNTNSFPSLDDNGRMDEVLTIYVNCAERNGVAAFAVVYRRAKCFGPNKCHGVVDGASLRSPLCDNAAAECGQTLFKEFDTYVIRSNPTELKLDWWPRVS